MLINQIHSIGDILFIEPICREIYQRTGKKPVLPVRDHLFWLNEYIESANIWPLSSYQFDIDNTKQTDDYLPLRFANQIIRKLHESDHSDFENCMPDKYQLAGLNLDKWLKIDLVFNHQKCKELLKVLSISNTEKFILVNENSQAGRIKITPNNPEKLRIVKMEHINGFTLLDWAYVMVFAKENHHVSTSTFFMMQAVSNQFKFDSKVFLYPRPNADGLRGISKLNPSFKIIKCD